MKTNPIESVFLWLSNTDENLYALCPQNVRRARISFGIFVLITGLLAMVTGSYFIRSFFSTYNEVTELVEVSAFGWVVSLLFGLIWGLLIILIERKIVSSTTKWRAALGILLAIVIGSAIAITLEVQFFSDKINKELTISSQQENTVFNDQKNTVIKNQYYTFPFQFKQLKIMKESNKMLASFSILLTICVVLILALPFIEKLVKRADEYDDLLKTRIFLSQHMPPFCLCPEIYKLYESKNNHSDSNDNFQYDPKSIIKIISDNLK